MVVDRGELRYKIQVDDAFTSPIRKFRQELLLAKGTIEDVKNSTLGLKNLKVGIVSATKATKTFRDEKKREASEDRTQRAEQLKKLRQLSAGIKQTAKNEKLRASLAKEITRRQREVAKAALAAGKAQEVASRRAAIALRKARAENRKFIASLLKSGDAANRVGFTFRRLFGILAAFTVARQAVGGFTALINTAISFNRTIEDSRIGIGSLFAALGDVTNKQGDLVTGQEAFAEATKIAGREMKQLRLDSLRTAATFEELVFAFQTATGPGLSGGLEVDEIRKVAVLVSQAASALTVPQNQLAEEIRALLIPGAATSRTSRIFTALQITPAELKAAKEGGKLFEFLQDRLKTFDFAAEATQKTFSGLLARLRDAIGIGAGISSRGFFDGLKKTLFDIANLFVTIERDAEGAIKAITPNPRAVAVLSVLFDGLATAAATIRNAFGGFDLSRVIASTRVLSGVINGIVVFLVAVVQGLVQGFGDISKLVRSIFGSIDPDKFSEIVTLITRSVSLLGTFGLLVLSAVGGLKLLFAPLFIAVSLMGKLLGIARTTFGILQLLPAKFLASIGAMAAVIGLISFGLKEGLSSLLAFEVGFKDLPEVIGAIIEQIGTKVVGLGNLIADTLRIRALQGFQAFDDAAAATLDAIANLVDEGLAAAGSAPAAVRIVERDRAAVDRELESAKIRAGLELEIQETKKVASQIDADADRRSGDRIQALRAQIAALSDLPPVVAPEIDTSGIEKGVLDTVLSLNGLLDGIFGKNVVDEEGLTEALERAKALIKEATDEAGEVAPKSATDTATAFEAAFEKILENADSFLSIMTRAVDRFATFAGDAIVDAFDPTSDVSIRERFARFLQDIAKQIIATLVKVAVAKTVLAVGGLFPGGAVGDAPGMAEGGEIPTGKAKPFARPAHVDPRDTTPIWAQPGEFMQRLSSVQKYGMDVMEAINDGLIDPTALRALAGIGSHRKMRTSGKHGPGYVSGGSITAQAQAVAAAAPVEARNDQPTIALVAGNEQSMDALLAGGKRAMLDFIKANGPAIDGMLARNRSK